MRPPDRSTWMVGLRALFYVVVGVGALVVLVPPMIDELAPGPLFWLGVPVIVVGAALYLWTTWSFVNAGRGTPLPIDPPRELVIQGPYRAVRNPMALGFLLVVLGEAVAFGSWRILVYAGALLVAIQLFILFYEEPGLKRRFGESYEAYRRSVRRWLPRLSGFRR